MKQLKLSRDFPVLSSGKVDACGRRTWHPDTNRQGRCWVCSPEEGEELCEWCRDEEWRQYNDELLFNHRDRLKRAELDASPYHEGLNRPISRELVIELGSPEAAIQAIVANYCGYSGFSEELPSLLAWNLPTSEAIRRWYELLAEADRLLLVFDETSPAGSVSR
jgi:hypothetical protein